MTSCEKNYGIMKTFFDHQGFEALRSLAPQEREFAYYISMAAITGYPIALFQRSPHPDALKKIANYLLAAKPDGENEREPTTKAPVSLDALAHTTDSVCQDLRV